MDPADPDTVRSREATDVVRNLPLTRHSTLHLDTDERPRLLPTSGVAPVDGPARRIPWLIIAGMTITLLIGLFLGRMF
jgi:hypothetical protein